MLHLLLYNRQLLFVECLEGKKPRCRVSAKMFPICKVEAKKKTSSQSVLTVELFKMTFEMTFQCYREKH